jgi:hypothetical protein
MSNHSEHIWHNADNTDAIVPFFVKVVPKPDTLGYMTYIHLGKDDEDTTFIRHFEDTLVRASNVWFEPTSLGGMTINRVRISKDFLSDRRNHGTDDYECGECTLTGQVWVSFRGPDGRRLPLTYDEVAKDIAHTLRWRFPMDEMVLATVGVNRDGSTHHPIL